MKVTLKILTLLILTFINSQKAAQLDSRLMRPTKAPKKEATPKTIHKSRSQNTPDNGAPGYISLSSIKREATSCIWQRNRKLQNFTDPTKHVAGHIIFLNGRTVLETIAYNPIHRSIKGTNSKGKRVIRVITEEDPLKKIGKIIGLDVTKLDTTEANNAIKRWLET